MSSQVKECCEQLLKQINPVAFYLYSLISYSLTAIFVSSDDVVQSFQSPNCNLKVACSMPCWTKRAAVLLGKTLNALIPTSGGSAKRIKVQVGNREIVGSWFGL